jgi:pyruvate, water dikinase
MKTKKRFIAEMTAFEKIKSGIDSIDKTLDGIRLGDNVVWQVSDIEEYSLFVKPFAAQAIRDGRNLVYMRFARHKPLLEPQTGLKIIKLDENSGFESFTIAVHEIIKKEGKEAFYIFDSLSELQVAWSADLMMGNFFVVTCPYLFNLNTVAYFCILRSRHSFDTIARIRETTQILLDIYSESDSIFIHPLKVWKRYSSTMFLPHELEKTNLNAITSLTGGLNISRFYSIVEKKTGFAVDQNLDTWDRFFTSAKMTPDKDDPEVFNSACERLIGREKKLTNLIKIHFEIGDLIAINEKLIGSGKIGGKASGMLLARKIIKNIAPEIFSKLEPHDSFYIGSDVYYTFIVQNNCWSLRLAQKGEKNYFSAAKKLKQKILDGIFPDTIREQFIRMLEYYGQNPIIVRSSSLLEDSFENAFAGKYESIFCMNSGSIEKRLSEFEKAVKQVYASTMDESALEYRLQRSLQKSDEQMAILVQRVSGMRFDNIFMPCAAGVGYSYNSYRWNKDIDPDAGMIRIVMGLGTRAVDRTEGDYPRIVSLDKPHLTPLTTTISKNQYSQHKADILDLEKNSLLSADIQDLLPLLPAWYKKIILEHDFETERILREQGNYREVVFSTCEGLINMKDFTRTLMNLMNLIEKEYKYPVDIEFTINFSETGEFLMNLLQCRPLQTGSAGTKIKFPAIKNENIFFELSGGTMGGAVIQPVDCIIQVDPEGYYGLPYKDKYSVARSLGKINHHSILAGKSVMLLVPGRIGTKSPELGIPVNFAEISNIRILCEISYKKAGYMPELSFGSHFFHDLVETGIFYAAILEDDNTLKFDYDFFNKRKNIKEIFSKIHNSGEKFSDVIKVYDLTGLDFILYSDIVSAKTICGIPG